MDIAKFPSENPNPVLRVTKEKVIYVNKSGQNLLDLTENSAIPSFFKDEIIKAFKDDADSYAMGKRRDSEKQADSAR